MNPNIIKGYRNHLGMTQGELADLLNISITSYRNKENGITNFTDLEKVRFTSLVNDIFPNETIESIFFSEYKTKKEYLDIKE